MLIYALLLQEAHVDGSGLLQLRELLQKDVQIFYNSVENNLKISKFGLVSVSKIRKMIDTISKS